MSLINQTLALSCNEPYSPVDSGSKFRINLSPTVAEALRDFLIYALTRNAP